MKTARIAVVVAMLTILSATVAMSAVPDGITVQGRLVDSADEPLPAGFKSFTFKIFDAASGGVLIWEETRVVQTDEAGLWTVRLGTTSPLSEVDFQQSNRWLEITVDDGVNPAETLSRVEMTTQAFVYHSAASDQADVANSATTAGHATTADNATNADNATTAGSATTASSATFAGNADLLDGLNSTAFAPTSHSHSGVWLQNGSAYYYNAGNVGIGTSSPTQKLHVAGNARVTNTLTVAGQISIASTTRQFVVPGATVASSTDGSSVTRSVGGYIHPASSPGGLNFYAPVNLPNGAVVTQAEFHFRLNSNSGLFQGRLNRATQGSGSTLPMALYDFSTPNSGNQTGIDNTITSATINNESYQYFVSGGLTNLQLGGTPSEVRLYSIEIQYTINQPLP